MGNDQPKSLLAIPAWRRPIKVGFDLMAGKTRKFLQLAQELQFIIGGIQPKANLRDQIVAIDEIAHPPILPVGQRATGGSWT